VERRAAGLAPAVRKAGRNRAARSATLPGTLWLPAGAGGQCREHAGGIRHEADRAVREGEVCRARVEAPEVVGEQGSDSVVPL